MADARQKLGAVTRSLGSFEAMADLPGFEEKKRALLRKLDEAYALGEEGRSYVDKNGEKHSQPDVSACIKCIELAARIMGVLAEAEKRVKLADDEQRAVDIETLANLLRGVGFKVEKAA